MVPGRAVRADRKINREAEILRMREEGMTQQAIADELGISNQRVSQILAKRAPLSAEEVAKIRNWQIANLHDLMVDAYARALEGDPDARRAYRGLDERLSKIAGTEAATKFELGTGDQGNTVRVWQILNPSDAYAPVAELETGDGDDGE